MSEIQILPERFEEVLDAVASQAVQFVGSQYSGSNLKQPVKLIETSVRITMAQGVADEHIFVGMCRGDASAAEVIAAIETPITERDEQAQANVREVIWNSIRAIDWSDVADASKDFNWEFKHAGGKGLPFPDGQGWKWFVYNMDLNPLTTASQIYAMITHLGVWL